MKGIVIYRSKSGFTRKYAEIIANSLNYDLLEYRDVDLRHLDAYENIIYGGGLYATGINGLAFIKKNLARFAGKNIAVYACGATPPRKNDIDNIVRNNFKNAELEKISFFYMRGGFDYKKLKPVDKLLMSILKMKLKAKKDIKGDELGMLNAYTKPMDFVSEKNARPLIDHCLAIEAKSV